MHIRTPPAFLLVLVTTIDNNMATSAGILQISSRGTFQYLPGQYPWSEKEEQQLQDALAEYPEGSFSGGQRYIMVASKIPTKTIRDVRDVT